MNYIADLHIHSPFSRATSPDCSPAGLAAWARLKGIQIVATGDLTHPGWFSLLQQKLQPAEPGLYRLKDESAIPAVLPGLPPSGAPVRFLLSAEISSIYKRHGVTRKVHNLLYLPDFASAQRLNATLAGIGNIESDGRPILGLDSRDLLEILLDCSPDAFLVPAHIWTPWFSLFGSKSGFDSVEECFGDLSEHIFALETGLSSDPDMNRLISALDRYALISNSDCHSPSKLGREANLFNTGFDFFSLRDALKSNSKEQFIGTIEFFPEEGKYHFDGHRDCKVCLDPHESRKRGNLCPVCGKPLTIGVHHRVLELADRVKPHYRDDAPRFYSLIPLPELLGELLQVGPGSRKVLDQYAKVIARFGSEFTLLLHTPLDELREYEPLLAEAVGRMRAGTVIRRPGYDGEFGVIKVFDEGELARLAGQSSLFGHLPGTKGGRRKSEKTVLLPVLPPLDRTRPAPPLPSGPNQQQQAAIQAISRRILVAAGPGTGKTFTLIARLARLLEQGADPGRIVVITFTNRAAEELQERLTRRCGPVAGQVFVGTFHRYCLERLRDVNPGLSVVGPEERERLLRRLFPELDATERNRLTAELASHFLRSSVPVSSQVQRYIDELVRLQAIDLDAVIPVFVQLLTADSQLCEEIQQQVDHLFVDEFQDVNRPQFDLVQLVSKRAQVFAIGDPDQAIYGFRGSDLRFFFLFAEQPGTLLLSLSTCYRCAPEIVQGASTLISRNLIRSGLTLQSDARCPDKGCIEVHSAPSPASEAELIVRRIEELLGGIESFSLATGRGGERQSQGRFSFGDIAVLFRLGRQAEEIAAALNRRGIPFQLVGSTPYYLSPGLRAAYYFIQAAAGSTSTAEWLELLGSLKGVGGGTIQRLDAVLPLQGDFIAEAGQQATAALKTTLQELAAQLESFRQGAVTQGLGLALESSLRYLGIDVASDQPQRLVQLAGSFGDDLAAFSHHLRQYSTATVYDPRAEAVALMTCHSAKGLEFPVVFMAGLEEGIFPCTLMGPPDMEEERRLFYVGLTRARERVILSFARRRAWVGRGDQHNRSRFIDELPSELLHQPAPRKPRRMRQNKTEQMELF